MHRITELTIRHLQDDLSVSEKEELFEWVNRSEENRNLFNRITNESKLISDTAQVEDSNANLLSRLKTSIPELNVTPIPVRRINWRISAAAAILIFVLIYTVIRVQRHKANFDDHQSPSSQKIVADVQAPSGSHTTLTLASGSAIIVDSAQDGTLAKEGGVNVSLNHSQIVYTDKTSQQSSTKVFLNTLTTAKGGQTSIVLADGSRIWLNAASSIRFPTNFRGNERRVILTGEAYFEITHNSKAPFIVQLKTADIKVLGTRFNVMAYENESSMKTTLLQGSVRIITGKRETNLEPGQQAVFATETRGAEIRVYKTDVDTAQAVAWKNGEFQFNISDIGEVMRQLERWYNVEVIYESDKPTIRLSGAIARNVSLSNVLKLLEFNGLHYKVDSGKIIILK
jgi:ferric-dicitrate binding protein FerR (iron transport regulator)